MGQLIKLMHKAGTNYWCPSRNLEHTREHNEHSHDSIYIFTHTRV